MIKCTITFRTARKARGTVRVALDHGTRLAALGHGRVNRGSAKLTLRMRSRAGRGTWKITVVLAQPHTAATTTTMKVRLR